MSAYGLCSRFVSEANDDPASMLNVLYVFAQNNSAQIAFDRSGFVIGKYEEAAKGKGEIRRWLKYLSYNIKRNVEFVDAKIDEIQSDGDNFAEIARSCVLKTLIVWSDIDYMKCNTQNIKIVDRCAAEELINQAGVKNMKGHNITINGPVGNMNLEQANNYGDINQSAIIGDKFNEISLSELVSGLRLLKEEMQKEADTSEARLSLFHVDEGVTAAVNGDREKVKAHLAAAGKWALSVAEKLSIGVAIKAISIAIGLGG